MEKTIVTLSSKEQTSIYGGDMKRIYNWEPRKDKNPKPQVIRTNN
jgi:hypothetical protein